MPLELPARSPDSRARNVDVRRPSTVTHLQTSGVRPTKGIGAGALSLIAIGVYWVLVGGTDAGVIVTPVRALNAGLAGVCIWLWMRAPQRGIDRIDIATLVTLLSFLISAIFSTFPRISLDAAAAAVAWTAALFIGRRLASQAHIRRFALEILGATGVALALLFGLLWVWTWYRFFELTGFHSWPPLGLALPTLIFRHPHVVALTVVVLAPAVLSLWPRRGLRPVVILAISAIVFIAIASGSRTIWLASLISSALTTAMFVRDRELSGRRVNQLIVLFIIAVALLAVALLAVVWQLGIGQQVLDRLTTSGSIGARGEIWRAALHALTVDPLTGSGPGTFVQALPLSGYFQLNAFAPRHADNALIQLLSEGGLVAVAGAVVGATVVGNGLWKSGMKSAVWATAFLALSAFSDNPTDTAALNAIGIWWIALAAPSTSEQPAVQRSRPLAGATGAAFAFLIAAYVSVTVAAFVHDSAMQHAKAGDLEAARRSLRLVTALDPGMSLYERELGIVALAMNEPGDAVDHLRRAIAILPTDDLTRRALAVAELAAGYPSDAVRSIQEAAQDSQAIESNLVLEGWILSETDGPSARERMLVAIQQDPLLLSAPSWRRSFPKFGTEADLLRTALDGIDAQVDRPTRLTYEPMWLRAMAHAGAASKSDLDGARRADLPYTSQAWVLLLDCRVEEATRVLADAQAVEGESGLYWFVRIAAASASGRDATNLRALATMVEPSFRSGLSGMVRLSPLQDAGHDRRMYGRLSLPLLPGMPILPSGAEAGSLWMLDPFSAADAGAPESRLAACH